ncbi:UDP-2,3-diacylglucosamine diphosphatase LpxI [Rhodobacterales bacterium HKCCE2091]|nr:UDP-2,3-diacylglucosamine diphosphatase LpxI [Rhodobacterales bacterium HKCCE2091]
MKRAIIAGDGVLPSLLLAAGPAEIVRFAGTDGLLRATVPARFEQLGVLFSDLRTIGVGEIVFAGGMSRPMLDPRRLDPVTEQLLPRLTRAMAEGDNTLLSTIVSVFEGEGFKVRGAHEIRPDLLAGPGAITGAPSAAQELDAARARAVLEALGPVDVGQSAAAARGQVIGIETLQGTDAMLHFIARTMPGSYGVLVKRPKTGQDLRVDMPAIGPDTVVRAAAAGLHGIEIAAGGVLMLDPRSTRAAAEAEGVSIWAVP